MSAQDPWLGEVGEAMERCIATSVARPDFLDVVARAHELDPEAFPARKVHEAGELEPELAEGIEAGSASEEVEVDAWLQDVRAAVERQVDARREAPLPGLAAPAGRRGTWWVAGAAVAVAAMLLVGIGQVARGVAEPTPAPEQALRMSEAPGSTGTVDVHESRSGAALRQEHEAATLTPKVMPSSLEPEVSEPAPEVLEPESKPEPSGLRRSSTARGDRFAALADEAQAHWRAGRLDQAQRLFAKIVAEAGRGRAAEMAYADLFTLASQVGDPAAQRRWWKAYARRFPRGRFADDARAGLCRAAPSSERTACWQAYLDDFTRGSFRGEARSALGIGAP